MAEEQKRARDRFGRFLPGGRSAEEDEGDDEAAGAADPAHGSAESGEVDISDTPAPSIGPHTTFEKHAPTQAADYEPSTVDAMGRDKRRPVVGGRYSPSIARQATIYGIFLAVVAALAIGFIVLANELDQPPETNEDVAPWSSEDAAQVPPAPLDFPRY
ncbi:MAG: hypothetical protein ACRDK9_14160, partial [Solirubrobacterales bacterium]